MLEAPLAHGFDLGSAERLPIAIGGVVVVQVAHGLAQSLEQFAAAEQNDPGFSRGAAEFFDSLVSHYVLDDGRRRRYTEAAGGVGE